jgi:hypothetical protein
MAVSHARDEESTEREEFGRCVFAHCTSPGRTVFTEEGNTDGWIATTLTVELRR